MSGRAWGLRSHGMGEVVTMDDEDTIQHDEVVSSLLDLQRRLRADGAGAGERTPEEVAVSETELTVAMTPPPQSGPVLPDPAERFAPVTQLPTAVSADDRVAALTQRLGRLEQDLTGVLDSIGTMRRSVTEAVTADVAGRIDAARVEAEARAARLVAERLEAVKDRLSGELGEQRRDLAGLLEQRIRDMEAGLRNTIYDVVAGDGDRDGHDPDDHDPR